MPPQPVTRALGESLLAAIGRLNIIVMAWGAEHYYETHNGGLAIRIDEFSFKIQHILITDSRYNTSHDPRWVPWP